MTEDIVSELLTYFSNRFHLLSQCNKLFLSDSIVGEEGI